MTRSQQVILDHFIQLDDSNLSMEASYTELARTLGLGRRTVIAAVKNLIADGLIDRASKGVGRSQPNIYKLVREANERTKTR